MTASRSVPDQKMKPTLGHLDGSASASRSCHDQKWNFAVKRQMLSVPDQLLARRARQAPGFKRAHRVERGVGRKTNLV